MHPEDNHLNSPLSLSLSSSSSSASFSAGGGMTLLLFHVLIFIFDSFAEASHNTTTGMEDDLSIFVCRLYARFFFFPFYSPSRLSSRSPSDLTRIWKWEIRSRPFRLSLIGCFLSQTLQAWLGCFVHLALLMNHNINSIKPLKAVLHEFISDLPCTSFIA